VLEALESVKHHEPGRQKRLKASNITNQGGKPFVDDDGVSVFMGPFGIHEVLDREQIIKHAYFNDDKDEGVRLLELLKQACELNKRSESFILQEMLREYFDSE